MITPVNRARTGKVTLEREPRQLRHLRWNFVRHHGDDAASAKRDDRERDGVVAGENDEVLRHRVQNRGHLRDVAGGFLDADDIFNLREPLHCSWLNVHPSPSLHAIQNNRQRNCLSDGAIMLEQAFLRRLVVIRRDGENSIRAESGQLARQRYHLRSVVASGPSEDGDLSLSEFDGDFHYTQMFFMRQRRAFAGRSARYEEVDACVDLPPHQLAHRCFIKRTVASKWRDKSSAGPSKHGLSPCFASHMQLLKTKLAAANFRR